MDVPAAVDALNLALFADLESETTQSDRRSLLALHAACAEVDGTFAYLEIGSHLGGSLQALVRDPRCDCIVSIDPRPLEQPDERGPRFRYEDNSTQRMLDGLRAIDAADIGKIRTIEASTEDLDPAAVRAVMPRPPRLAFIDGEHTDAAALRDARFCRTLLGDAGGAIAFHDAWIVHGGISSFIEETRASGAQCRFYLLPDSVLVAEFGAPRLMETQIVTEQIRDGFWGYLWLAALRRADHLRKAVAP